MRKLLVVVFTLSLLGCDPKNVLLALPGAYTGTYTEYGYRDPISASVSYWKFDGRDRLDIQGADADMVPFSGEIDFSDYRSAHIAFYNGTIDEQLAYVDGCFVGKVSRICLTTGGFGIEFSEGITETYDFSKTKASE